MPVTRKVEHRDVPISDLIPYEDNPRKNDKAVKKVAASLEQFGLVKNSVVVDENMELLAGHTTLKAMRSLGWTACPAVTQVFGLTEEEKRAYRIADNKLGEVAEWDLDLLAGELASLNEVGFDAELTGFDTDALAELYPPEKPEVADDDYEPPVEIETSIQRGDLFRLGRHRLLCGDSTSANDVARLIGGVKIDCLLTDPPYCSGGFQEAGKKAGSVGTRGDEMVHNDTLSTRGYQALIKTTISNISAGLVYIFTDWRMWVNLFDVVESSGYGVRNMVVWDKGSPGMGVGWRAQHELVLCGMAVTHPFNPHKAQGNVIQCKRTGNVNHPTEKPVELLAKILDVSDIAKTIADPFLGSGTTLVACEQLGRICYGMEISPQYCQVIIDRWEKLTGQKAEKVDA